MLQTLPWLFALLATLTWQGAALATPARVSNLPLRIFIWLLLSAPPVSAWCWIVWLAWETRAAGIIPAGLFWLVMVLAAVYLGATIAFLFGRWWRRPARLGKPVTATDPSAPAENASSAPAAPALLRRRTVLALYGLALMAVGLHLFSLFVLKNTTADFLAEKIALADHHNQARQRDIQATVVADRVAPNHSRFEILLGFFHTGDTSTDQRRQEMGNRMILWHRLADSPSRRIADQRFAWLPDETVENTKGELSTRLSDCSTFSLELAELRSAANLQPEEMPFHPQRFADIAAGTTADLVPNIALSILCIDAEAAAETGDFSRALDNFASATCLQRLVYPATSGSIGYDSLTVSGRRKELVECLFSTDGLTVEHLDQLAFLPDDEARRQLPIVLDEFLRNCLQAKWDAAKIGETPRTSSPYAHSDFYTKWLDLAYWVPTGSHDQIRTVEIWRPLCDHPFVKIDDQLDAPGNYQAEGFEGVQLRQFLQIFVHWATELDMNEDLLRVGKALARYRLAHNRYPQELSALAPGFLPVLPLDRFTGQSLHYRVDDTGLGATVWSVGADGVNNEADSSHNYDDAEPDLTLFLGNTRARILEIARAQRAERLNP